MRDFLGPILFLLMFGACATSVILDDMNRGRCTPVCAPHAYAGKVVGGQCVCNTNQIVKGE